MGDDAPDSPPSSAGSFGAGAAVEDAEVLGTVQRLLDTPRTKDAFLRSGLTKKDLTVKAYQDFFIPGDLPEKQRLRFNHYETRRQEKLNLVLQERAKIIAERAKTGGLGDTLNYQSLQLMEGLLDTESKRLEKTLRAQLRYHQAVERENGLQLTKEQSLKGKLGYRQERSVVAKSVYGAKAKQLKEISAAKEKHAKELQEKLEQSAELEQAKHIANLLDEEVRLKEFAKSKDVANSEKSERWKEKCRIMKLRKEEEDLKRELKGQVQLEKLNNKFDEVEAKQADTIRKLKVKHEEEALKIVDAQDKIVRLRRKDEHRRELIKAHMEQQEERVDTLLKLRDQIVQQRKWRIKQAAVVKGRPQNIRHMTPGPAHYQPLPSCLNDLPVPKIASHKPPNMTVGSIDMMVKHAKTVPPPGTYDPQVLPSGNHLDWNVIDGCTTRLVPGDKKNYIDDSVRTYKNNPDPGTYELKSSNDLRHSVRIVRDYVDTSDKPPKWCQPKTDTPAPDEYVLDKYMKTGRFQHASSAPQLAAALKMSG